jgi:LacI family transcriptional regulator
VLFPGLVVYFFQALCFAISRQSNTGFPDEYDFPLGRNGRFLVSMKIPDTPDIVLRLRLSRGSGRDVLHGFSTAVRRMRRRWRLHVLNAELERSADDLRAAIEAGADGVVSHGVEASIVDVLGRFDKPVVFIAHSMGIPWSHPGKTVFVSADDAAVGRFGADYLASLGNFRSWAFVDNLSQPVRSEAFRMAVARRNAEAQIYESPNVAELDVEQLAKWLGSLPRPIAAMAAHDAVAVAVLEAAAHVGLRVPKDIAVLGVDNDELLCETAEPPISSVAMDHERLGELAAEEIRRMLEQPGAKPSGRLAPVRGVVERQSARSLAPTAALVARAVAYIRHNAVKGIGAADVAKHLGASRSLVDQRFRKATGESVLEMIRRVRLEAVRAKLRNTTLPIGQIARSCGFETETHAMHLFKARFGCTMREWRRRERGN